MDRHHGDQLNREEEDEDSVTVDKNEKPKLDGGKPRFALYCHCGIEAKRGISEAGDENAGRHFIGCGITNPDGNAECTFLLWIDELQNPEVQKEN